jgi:membrane protein implicated in regulation of membrane protease activity
MTPAVEIWWIWIAAGILLAVIEIIVPGVFILPFTLGAIAAGVLAYAGHGPAVQWTAFGAVSGVLLPLALIITKRIMKKLPPAVGSSRMVGMRGPVTIAVDNRKNKGHVRLGGELWRAESELGGDIPVGIVVEVTAVKGIRVVVREISKEH